MVVSECADSAISQSSAHGLYLSFSLVRFLEFSFFLSFFLFLQCIFGTSRLIKHRGNKDGKGPCHIAASQRKKQKTKNNKTGCGSRPQFHQPPFFIFFYFLARLPD